MENTTSDALVLRDGEGEYYVLPRELIELSRARPENRAQLEEQFGGIEPTGLGAGFSFVGVVSVPEETSSAFGGWPGAWPETAWPESNDD